MEFVEFAHSEASQTVSTQELPGWEQAWIPESKLKDYVLSETHEVGQHKARVFRSELGIEGEHWQVLHDQILDAFPEAQATFRQETEFGLTWEVPILVIGRNEVERWVTTGWIVEFRDRRPKLTTAYLQQSRLNEELQLLEAGFQRMTMRRRLSGPRMAFWHPEKGVGPTCFALEPHGVRSA